MKKRIGMAATLAYPAREPIGGPSYALGRYPGGQLTTRHPIPEQPVVVAAVDDTATVTARGIGMCAGSL